MSDSLGNRTSHFLSLLTKFSSYDKYLLLQVMMQESHFYIYLLELYIHDRYDHQNYPNIGKTNYRWEGLIEVDPQLVSTSLPHSPRLESLYIPIYILLHLKNLQTSNCILSLWQINKFSNSILLKWLYLLLHHALPLPDINQLTILLLWSRLIFLCQSDIGTNMISKRNKLSDIVIISRRRSNDPGHWKSTGGSTSEFVSLYDYRDS